MAALCYPILVPDLAKMLNSAGYRNGIFYLLCASLKDVPC